MDASGKETGTVSFGPSHGFKYEITKTTEDAKAEMGVSLGNITGGTGTFQGT